MRRELFFSFLLLYTQQIWAQTFTYDASLNLPNLEQAEAVWIDYNKDGYLDLLLSGRDGSMPLTYLYRNNGGNTWTNVTSGIVQLYDAVIKVGDFDNDNFPDFAISGLDQNNKSVLRVYKNNNGIGFSEVDLGVNLGQGGLVWADFNKDGHLELLVTGVDESYTKQTKIFRYKEGLFEEQQHNLPAIAQGELHVLDFDKNGQLEVLVTGTNALLNPETSLYEYQTNFEFKNLNQSFAPIVSFGKSKPIDWNNDGYTDLLIAGRSLTETFVKLYENQSGLGFIEKYAFPAVSNAIFEIIDYDQDGDEDVFLGGGIAGDIRAYFFENGSGTFTEVPAEIPDITQGVIRKADYNNDQKLDLLVAGKGDIDGFSYLYKNIGLVSNEPPTAPSDLQADVVDNTVRLSIATLGADATSPTQSLRYNYYVGTSTQKSDIYSPLANLSTGHLFTPDFPLLYQSGEVLELTELAEGEYFYAAQTIDQNGAASAFSTEASFVVCDKPNLGEDFQICAGAQVDLNIGTSNDIVNWYDLSNNRLIGTGNTLNTILNTDIEIEVSIQKPLGCIVKDTIAISLYPEKELSLGGNRSVCDGESISFDLSEDNWAKIQWTDITNTQDLGTATTLELVITETKELKVTCEDLNGCVYTDQVVIEKIELPTLDLGGDKAYCEGSEMLIDLSSYAYTTVAWYNEDTGQLLSDIEVLKHIVVADFTLKAVVTKDGCTSSDQILITKNELPEVNFGATPYTCKGEEFTFDLSSYNFSEVEWYVKGEILPQASGHTWSYTPEEDTEIEVVFKDNLGCINTASTILKIHEQPVLNIGDEIEVCVGTNYDFDLRTQNWQSLSWTDLETGLELGTTEELSIEVLSDIHIGLTVTDINGCVATDEVWLRALERVEVSLGNDIGQCKGSEYIFDLSNEHWSSVRWISLPSQFELSNTVSYTHTFTTDETVMVEVIDEKGCVGYDTIELAVVPLPVLDLGDDRWSCAFENFEIDLSTEAYSSVAWYDATEDTLISTQAVLQIAPRADFKIRAVVSSQEGCESSDEMTIRIYELPSIDLGADRAVCHGSTTTFDLTANNYQSVQWRAIGTNEILGNENDLQVEVTQDILLEAQVTDANGCVNYDTVFIEHLPLPVINLGNDQNVCMGEETTFDLSSAGFSQVNWYEKGNPIALSETQKIFTYTMSERLELVAEVWDIHGCVNYDTVIISPLELPVIDLGGSVHICQNESLQLDLSASNATTFYWESKQKGFLSDKPFIDVEIQTPDEIYVRLTNGNGCEYQDTLMVEMWELPSFSLGEDQLLCQEAELLLKAPTGMSNVHWYTLESNQTLSNEWFYLHKVEQTQEIVCLVTNLNGCQFADTLKVEMEALPKPDLGADLSICYGEELNLTLENQWESIRWFSAFEGELSNTNSLVKKIYNTETIYVEVISVLGCIERDTIKVSVIDLPTFELGEDRSICDQEFLTLTTGQANVSSTKWYSKQKGLLSETSHQLDWLVLENDLIWAEVENNNGCYYADTIAVSVVELPQFSLGENQSVCYNTSIDLAIEGNFLEVNWYNKNGLLLENSTNLSHNILTDEQIYAKVTSLEGCVAYDTIEVQMIPLPKAQAGEDLTICWGAEAQLGQAIDQYEKTDYQFQWYPSAYLSDPQSPNPQFLGLESQEYILEIRTAEGCLGYADTVAITVNKEVIAEAGEDLTICWGTNVILGGAPTGQGGTGHYTYQWTPETGLNNATIANPEVIELTEKTTFQVIVYSDNCIPDTANVTVDIIDLPTIRTSEDVTIGSGGSTTLAVEGGLYYLWEPDYNMDNPISPTPTVNPEVNTTYTVTAYNESGCTQTDTVNVYVENELFVPDLFTPNGDQKNDRFKVYGFGIKSLSLRITDRAGKTIYHSNNMTDILENGWDGTMNGYPAEADIYFWHIEGYYVNGVALSYKGNQSGTIRLIR